MRNTIPHYAEKYFWDIDLNTFDPKKYSFFIIERILDYGDEKAVIWLFKHYAIENIRNVADQSRSLTNKSKYFWLKVLK